MSRTAQKREADKPRRAVPQETQPRFKPVAVRAVAAACAVRGHAVLRRKVEMNDLPAILRDQPTD